MWVNKKTTPYGSAIVQILIKNSPYVGDVLWGFSNTVPGPFDKTIYNPPKLNCVAPPFGLTKSRMFPPPPLRKKEIKFANYNLNSCGSRADAYQDGYGYCQLKTEATVLLFTTNKRIENKS